MNEPTPQPQKKTPPTPEQSASKADGFMKFASTGKPAPAKMTRIRPMSWKKRTAIKRDPRDVTYY